MTEILLNLVVRLADFACWLCSKRQGAELRLGAERLIKARQEADKRGHK